MQFAGYATRREELFGLAVQPSILGKSHSFQIEEGRITVSLPRREEDARTTRAEWLGEDIENDDTTWYAVGSVDVRLDLARDIHFDGDDHQFRSNDVMFSDGGREAFERATKGLDSGFDLWKRTIRWTAFAPTIALNETFGSREALSGKGCKIIRLSDDRVFRNHGGTLIMVADGKVDKAAWVDAEEALLHNFQSPVWIDFLIDSQQRAITKDWRTAILNTAISCETAIRTLFWSTLPETDSVVATRILNQANISGLMNSFMDISGWSKTDLKLRGGSAVLAIFQMRNDIMHNGQRSHIGPEVQKLLNKAILFILHVDEQLAGLTGRNVGSSARSAAMERLKRI